MLTQKMTDRLPMPTTGKRILVPQENPHRTHGACSPRIRASKEQLRPAARAAHHVRDERQKCGDFSFAYACAGAAEETGACGARAGTPGRMGGGIV